MSSAKDLLKVATIISDAGGRVVGRTRLQKIAYLLSITGQEQGFAFGYKHYGPFSETLASAARISALLGQIHEAEQPTSWGGGSYSIYTTGAPSSGNSTRQTFARIAAEADAVELELAATAVFLSKEGYGDPWNETARRKPEKADGGRIDRAKELLNRLGGIQTPTPLPPIA
jgi:uncharacterized protein YwgA